MPMKLLDADAFRDGAKSGTVPEGTLFKFATTEAETVDGAARTKRFIFSDATVDHSGDSIDPKGWQLDVFKSNPVALFSHMSWDPPIGRAANVHVEAGKLVGEIEFATADVYEFADTIYRLVDGGFLKAVSVGFIPKEWTFTSDKNRPYGIDFKKQLLVEISVCAVPCNPAALGEARSMGVDTRPLEQWAERVLDNNDTIFIPRKDIEALRNQAKSVAAPLFYFEASRSLKPSEAISVREAAKSLQEDPTTTLILPEGVTLRAIEPEPAEFDSDAEAAAVEAAISEAVAAPSDDLIRRVATIALKAGRRISAATKTKLQAMQGMHDAHHEAMTKCIKDVMGGDDTDDDEPDDDFDDLPPSPTEQPPASVVQENLSPEEQRLKEVRALRETLPASD